MRTKLAVAALALAACPAVAQVGGDVIYGDDDRLDLYQVTDARVLKLADSTVGLFDSNRVEVDAAANVAKLVTASYSEEYSLCQEEPFFDQRTGAFCSGSLVAPDVIMTAGHCVRSEGACAGTKFVFGFAIKERGNNPESVPAGDVYGCQKLLGRVEEGRGADWALVKLDRPVAGHAPLKVNRAQRLEAGQPMFVVGHPAGLPTKVAGGAAVRDPSPDGYFVANLDTYGGNSGSAVFNAKTLEVEGILVRGEVDYEWRNSCRVSKVCANDGCRGEDVTKASALADQIPAPEPSGPGVQATAVRAARTGPALAKLLELYGVTE